MADNTAISEGVGRGEAAAARLAQIQASSVQAGLVKAPDLAQSQSIEAKVGQGHSPRFAGINPEQLGQLDKVMSSLKGAVRGGDGASQVNPQSHATQQQSTGASWQNYVKGTGPSPSAIPGKGGGRGPGG